MKETDSAVHFIDMKMPIVFLLFFVILWIAFSVKLIICLRFQFIFLSPCAYYNFFSHYKMTPKHTIHIEQTSVPSIKVIPSMYFPPFAH